jgi:hypothetical protein
MANAEGNSNRAIFVGWQGSKQSATIALMTTVEVRLDLPDRLAKEALRRQNFNGLLSAADRVDAAGIPPMSAEELNAEIQAYRMERRRAGSVEFVREPIRSSR